MEITLTHLRQNLFALADEVIRTGEALLIERKGVRLKLVRADAPTDTAEKLGRLHRLRSQELTIGAALDPAESPATWSAQLLPAARVTAAEPDAIAAKPTSRRGTPRR